MRQLFTCKNSLTYSFEYTSEFLHVLDCLITLSSKIHVKEITYDLFFFGYRSKNAYYKENNSRNYVSFEDNEFDNPDLLNYRIMEVLGVYRPLFGLFGSDLSEFKSGYCWQIPYGEKTLYIGSTAVERIINRNKAKEFLTKAGFKHFIDD